jgi:hypothetical protein
MQIGSVKSVSVWLNFLFLSKFVGWQCFFLCSPYDKGIKYMTRKILAEMEKRISDHFYNEAAIMKDILECNLTDKESKELGRFIKNHPFSELSRYLQEVRQKKRTVLA